MPTGKNRLKKGECLNLEPIAVHDFVPIFYPGPVGRNFTTLHLLINIMMKGLEQNPTMLHQISYFDLGNLTQI